MYRSGFVPVPRLVSLFGPWGFPPTLLSAMGSPSSANYEASDVIAYYPIVIPTTCVVRRAWWANGDTVSASYTIDVGLYADGGYKPGAKLVSCGATAQGTALEVQFADVTDTSLAAGLYWFAIVCSNSAATFIRSGVSTGSDLLYKFKQISGTLPATATPIETAAAEIYLFGFATTASP